MWPLTHRIAIVGAGPVGLTLANLLWDLGYRQITIFEKRYEYTRKQIVAIDDDVYHLLLPEYVTKRLINNSSCFLGPVLSLGRPQCITQIDPSLTVWQLASKLKSLEQALYDYTVSSTGIKVTHKEFKGDEDKDYDIIIGADGTNSVVRENTSNRT